MPIVIIQMSGPCEQLKGKKNIPKERKDKKEKKATEKCFIR